MIRNGSLYLHVAWKRWLDYSCRYQRTINVGRVTMQELDDSSVVSILTIEPHDQLVHVGFDFYTPLKLPTRLEKKPTTTTKSCWSSNVHDQLLEYALNDHFAIDHCFFQLTRSNSTCSWFKMAALLKTRSITLKIDGLHSDSSQNVAELIQTLQRPISLIEWPMSNKKQKDTSHSVNWSDHLRSVYLYIGPQVVMYDNLNVLVDSLGAYVPELTHFGFYTPSMHTLLSFDLTKCVSVLKNLERLSIELSAEVDSEEVYKWNMEKSDKPIYSDWLKQLTHIILTPSLVKTIRILNLQFFVWPKQVTLWLTQCQSLEHVHFEFLTHHCIENGDGMNTNRLFDPDLFESPVNYSVPEHLEKATVEHATLKTAVYYIYDAQTCSGSQMEYLNISNFCLVDLLLLADAKVASGHSRHVSARTMLRVFDPCCSNMDTLDKNCIYHVSF